MRYLQIILAFKYICKHTAYLCVLFGTTNLTTHWNSSFMYATTTTSTGACLVVAGVV